MNKEFILLCLTFSLALAQWEVVGQDLIGATFSDTTWSYSGTCAATATTFPTQQGGCLVNNIKYAQIGTQSPLLANSLYKITNINPHYQVKIIIDTYLMLQTSWNNQLQVTINVEQSTAGSQNLQYKDNGNGANSVLGYKNTCDGTLGKFQVQTFILPYSHNDIGSIQLSLCSSFNTNQYFGYRTVQILINRCHWSCLKCESGSGAGQCRVCFQNPTTNLASLGTCACNTNTGYIEYLDSDKGCFTECHYYRVPDSNKVCQFNENMLPLITYLDSLTFTSALPLKFIPDPIYFSLDISERVALIPCQTTKSYVGPFYANEGYSLQLTVPSNIQYLRFRITILKFDTWVDYSNVRILLESQEVSQVYSLSQVLNVRNGIQLLSVTNCTNPTINYFRIETNIRTTLTNPMLYIIGNMDVSSSQSWGFRELVFDVMKCQSSCTSCDFDLKCYACSSGFLYKNHCVLSCPPFSTVSGNVCTDYDQLVDNSKYLVKAFYDFGNTTDSDVTSLFNIPTGADTTEFSTSDNFLSTGTKIYFSEYQGKRVLGGPLVWVRATFSKTYTLNYHYKIIFKFTVVLGDNFNGQFDYSIGGFTGSLTTSTTGATISTYDVGDAADDYIIKVDRTEVHTATANFQVSFTCNSQSSKKVNDQFCLLYDYYIIILECSQYCTSCSGPLWTDCLVGNQLSLPTGMSSPTTCTNNTYYLDTTVTPAVCRTCTPTYCLECSSQYVCTKCATNFYLTNGQCQCLSTTYLNTNTCVNCSSYCKSCYGSTSSQCLSCNDSQHRYINNNQCLCKNNYYDDGVNFTCQSVCGDMVVTDGEECDDGNTLKFDGCYLCKYDCQKECSLCVKGKCEACITGYILHSTMKICYPHCGDNLIVGFEQCEDNNPTPYDGCYNCMYSCEPLCTSCIEGVCYQCNQLLGYYINLATHKCETQCGDKIQVGIEECDDGNQTPYDGCYNCFYQCDEACSICINGICQICQTGFEYSKYTNKCEAICGDKIVTFKEQCDDGNTKWYDGCYQCQYKCQDECSNCQFGICKECGVSGYHFDSLQRICITQCNDNVITPYFEQCEDNNNQPEDGCFQCQHQCQSECLTCALGVCYQCKSEYYLTSQKQCVAICGDGKVVQQEQCDDKNLLDEDGCSNCSYQCQKQCQNCQNGICTQCQQGYYLDSKILKCYPICGDSIILGDEQCDDGSSSLEINQKNITGCVNCQLQCESQCEVCAFGQCQRCKESNGWYLNQETRKCESLCGDWKISSSEECDDNNSLNDGCSYCKFQCEVNCDTCKFGQCQKCLKGYYLINQKCQSQCGDGIVTQDEDCDVGNLNIDGYGCVNCKYKCTDGCSYCYQGECQECQNNNGWYLNYWNQQCESECGDQIISGLEMCDDLTSSCDSCNLVCDDSCVDCAVGVCSKCEQGYQLSYNQCEDVCGNQIITKNEQCDDGDIMQFDGCFECNYSCQNECIDCYFGQCIQCDEQSGWYLLNNYCQTFCGDGIKAGDEECDINLSIDNGVISQNKCFKCKYACDSNCSSCQQGICDKCVPGFYLDKDKNICQSMCGDLIVKNQAEEMCEDDNLYSFDGCYSCQYDCVEKCQHCLKGFCLNCVKGYILDDNGYCIPKCGDGIVVNDESCDDGNNIEFDGCFKCQYSCPQFCNSCSKGKCSHCETGYHLEFNYCESDCKDLIIKEQEKKCFVQECQKECLQCYNGECLVCKKGWQLNQVKKICESLCGDDIVVGSEQCDYFSSLEKINPKCNLYCQFECPSNCYNCQFGQCQKCLQGYQLINNQCINVCGDLIKLKEEECEQFDFNDFNECFSCKQKCEVSCQTCVQGLCEQCKVGYELIDRKCVSICGDGIITLDEDCDDKNYSSLARCDQCKFSCDQNCKFCEFGKCHFCKPSFQLIGKNCVPICGDGIISGGEQCDDGNLEAEDGCFECQYSCQSQCLSCQTGYCILCEEEKGWNLKPQGICASLCGDAVTTGNEQCDDGNDVNFDGCFNCRYICQEPCTKCLSGSCYECNTPGWILDNFWCWEVCGDGLKVGIEECDDGNEIPYDGCFNCKSQCDEACTVCVAGVCQQCTYGWKLNNQSRCEVDCGDSYVLKGFEDCDDGNLLPFDGCYECNFQCVRYCTLCVEGICQECNTLGWQIEKETHLCVPVCGDSMILGSEQCDDGNLIKYDGCNEFCEFECHQACLLCENGICIECDRYSGYLEKNNQCAIVCGDGLWEPLSEQCDDGNNQNFDGCSKNCKIEENWYCDNQQLLISNCIYRQQPQLNVNIVSQTQNKYILSISFNTKMKLENNSTKAKLQNIENQSNQNQDELFSLKILELNESEYTYNFIPIIKFDSIPQNVEYKLEIVFQNNIDLDKVNLIIFIDKDGVSSENSVFMSKNYHEISLPISFYIDSNESTSLTYVKDFQRFAIYATVSVTFFSIFTSGYSSFFIALDTIQYLYYSRYINLNFPNNLQEYLDGFKKVSLTYAVDQVFQFQLFAQSQAQNSQNTDISSKFSRDGLGSSFFENAQASMISLTVVFSIYGFASITYRLLNQIDPYAIYNLGSVVGGTIMTIMHKSQRVIVDFFYSGAIRLITINFYELTFAALLQLSNIQIENTSQFLNVFSAFSTISLQFVFMGVLFNKIRQFQTKSTLNQKQSISTLFKHFDSSKQNQFWVSQYNTFLLMKKTFYIVTIVSFQQQGFFQTLSVSIQAAIFSTYLYIACPLKNANENKKALMTEVGMFLNTLTFSIYSLEQYIDFNSEILYYFGWMNISVYTMIISFNTMIDSYAQLQVIYEKIKKLVLTYIESQQPSKSRIQPLFI